MILTHDKAHFYKYASAQGAKSILEHCSIKLSRATEFNDPFDTYEELFHDFNPDDAPELFLKKIREVYEKGKPLDLVDKTSFGVMLNHLISNVKDMRAPDAKLFQKVCEPAIRGIKTFLKRANEAWQKFIYDNRIFCMAEEYSDLLMWSHYADSHKGAVIRFRVIPKLQSGFSAATPVCYSKKPPSLGSFDEVFYSSVGVLKRDPQLLHKSYIFTKSETWKYEKEWRVVLRAVDPSKPFDIIPIDRQEIDGVFLGCKIGEKDKACILNLIQNYPKIDVFQAMKKDRGYGLQFDEAHF